MNEDIKQKWIGALRSGKFQQGKGQLRSRGGNYCCLGVLCEVANIPMDTSGNACAEANGLVVVGYQPLLVMIDEHQMERLWKMNDVRSRSFLEIADWIEKNIKATAE